MSTWNNYKLQVKWNYFPRSENPLDFFFERLGSVLRRKGMRYWLIRKPIFTCRDLWRRALRDAKLNHQMNRARTFQEKFLVMAAEWNTDVERLKEIMSRITPITTKREWK